MNVNPIKQKFFKAFRHNGSNLISANPSLNMDWIRTYLENQLNVCPVGKFFCFETKEQAIGFCCQFIFNNWEVWEVEGYGNEKPSAILCIDDVSDQGLTFWRNKQFRGEKSSSKFGIPVEGTWFAKSVRLIRRVDKQSF